jgi:hypothetical protein
LITYQTMGGCQPQCMVMHKACMEGQNEHR